MMAIMLVTVRIVSFISLPVDIRSEIPPDYRVVPRAYRKA